MTKTGTHFQQSVWAEISKIPKGSVVTYKELANRLGGPMPIGLLLLPVEPIRPLGQCRAIALSHLMAVSVAIVGQEE